MITKTQKMYQIREYTGRDYSKQIGRRLRNRSAALRIVRVLKARGREVFAAPISVKREG